MENFTQNNLAKTKYMQMFLGVHLSQIKSCEGTQHKLFLNYLSQRDLQVRMAWSLQVVEHVSLKWLTFQRAGYILTAMTYM